MKSIKFIPESIQSKIILAYISISIIFTTISISCLPYLIFDPISQAEKLSMIFFGIIIFLLLIAVLLGLFVYDAASIFSDNSEKVN